VRQNAAEFITYSRCREKVTSTAAFFYVRQQRQSGIGLPVSGSARYRWSRINLLSYSMPRVHTAANGLEYINQAPPY
jgi:hypothetical protein